MIVDSHISEAIEKYLKANKIPAKELCKTLDISEPAFVKWRRPGKGILPRNWGVLFPLIKPYLPKSRFYIDERGEECYSSLLEGTGGSSYFTPKYIPQMVPVFTFKEIESFQYIVQSIEQYAIEKSANRIEYRPRVSFTGSGVFALNVDFENGIIPSGALLFASTELRPKSDGVTLFLESSGGVNIGRFNVVDGKYFINSGKETISGPILEISKKISWIFPVLYYEVVTF